MVNFKLEHNIGCLF